MEEGLKAVRLLHNVILTASAAVIAFASSPNDLSRLERLSEALSQTRTALVDYDRQAFDRYVENLVEEGTSFKPQLQVTLNDLGIAPASGLQASKLLPPRTHADLAATRDGRTPTLFEIAAALQQARPIEIFKPDDLRGELKMSLAPFAQTTASLHNLRSGNMNLTGRPLAEGYLDLSISRDSYLQQASTIKERIAAALPTPPRIVESVYPVQITVDARIHGQYFALKGETFAGWVAGQGKAGMSIDRETGAVKLAPPIVASLEQIGALSLDDAQQKIDRQLEEARARQYVSLLGVDVSAPHALIAAPLTLFILLTYLVSHVRHVYHRATAGDAILGTFPWIGLFDDRQSRWFTIASLVLVPLVANGWLLIRLSQARGWVIWTLALMISVATAWQSLVAILHVFWLRKTRLGTGARGGGDLRQR